MHVGPRRTGRAGRHERRQVDPVDVEPAVAGRPHPVVEHGAEAVRVAVAGERHHLVLVGGPPEPEVRRDLLVEQAERMRQPLGGQHVERPVAPPPAQVRGRLAPPVEHEDRRRRVRGGHAGRGGVGDVVGHVGEPVGGQARERGGQELGHPADVQRAQRLPVVGRDVGRPGGGGAGGTRSGSYE